MCDCGDCFNVEMDPLVGREAWRKSRLVGATGPTGPTGVVQDMASPTGPYSALVDNDSCQTTRSGISYDRLLGCPGSEIMGVFVTPTFGNHGGFYRDGTCRLTTMAPADCSRGAWIEVEVVPRQDYPTDSQARQSLPFSLNHAENHSPQSIQEAVGFILDERPLRFNGLLGPYTDPPAFGVGPVRIKAGYNDTTLFDVYDSSAAGTTTSVSIGLMPFAAGAQQDATRTRIASQALVSGVGYCFPIDAATSAIFTPGEAQSDSLKYNAVTVGFDANRMAVRPDISQANVRPPAVGGFFRPAITDNYTDVIVPTGATGSTAPVPLTAAAIHQAPPYNYFGYFPSEDLTTRFFSWWYSNTKDADKPQAALKTLCKAVNGPTWHERNIIWYGGSLAVDGARHKVRLEFDWEAPEPSAYCTASVTNDQGFKTWDVTCNPPFGILAGAVVDLLPVMAGRSLLPGQYASAGPVELPAINITSVQGTYSNRPGVFPFAWQTTPATVPVDISITPIIHVWATSSTATREIISEAAQPQFARTPTSWSSLSAPGTDGMTPDDYVELLPTLDFLDRRKLPAATPALRVDLEIWLRITVTSVDVSGFEFNNSFSGNITRYFRLLHPTLIFGFTDEEAQTLSDGTEISARVVASAAETPGFPGFNVPNKSYIYSGNPYKIQFSRYDP